MQVIIFGATGSLGTYVVKEALAKDYSVKAFTRNATKLKEIESPKLSIIQGDVFNFEDVQSAIKGTDAVLCCLGDGAKGTVRAKGTQNIIKAMEHLGVTRLICQTTLGIGDSWHNLNFFWKYIMFGFLIKKAFNDHKLQEGYINETNLDFTIVRPSAFTNEPSTQNFQVGFNAQTRNLRLKISRADVACFMVEQLSSDMFIKKTISISN
ncbi:MAG: SDR family oxidoreductase [Chitinophagaceae bacterium]|nr:MAG: SDR family oxidoreductase [Chitinophagaceae bacterium]